MARKARRNASCATSSASPWFPVMWKAVEYTRRWYFLTSSPNAAPSPRWARTMSGWSAAATPCNYRSRMDFRQPGGSLSLHLLLQGPEVVLDGGALHLLA